MKGFGLTRRLRRTNGYSLMELIIVIILATVAMPGIVGLYTTTLTNSQKAEFYAIADMLAREQMEIILADKAGAGAGYGYGAIDNAKYSSVNPTDYFSAFTRTVNITVVNSGDPYEYKRIVVTVTHPSISSVILTSAVYDHSGI